MTRAEQHLGRAAQLVWHEAPKKCFDCQSAFFVAQVAAHGFAAFGHWIDKRMARLVEVGA